MAVSKARIALAKVYTQVPVESLTDADLSYVLMHVRTDCSIDTETQTAMDVYMATVFMSRHELKLDPLQIGKEFVQCLMDIVQRRSAPTFAPLFTNHFLEWLQDSRLSSFSDSFLLALADMEAERLLVRGVVARLDAPFVMDDVAALMKSGDGRIPRCIMHAMEIFELHAHHVAVLVRKLFPILICCKVMAPSPDMLSLLADHMMMLTLGRSEGLGGMIKALETAMRLDVFPPGIFMLWAMRGHIFGEDVAVFDAWLHKGQDVRTTLTIRAAADDMRSIKQFIWILEALAMHPNPWSIIHAFDIMSNIEVAMHVSKVWVDTDFWEALTELARDASSDYTIRVRILLCVFTTTHAFKRHQHALQQVVWSKRDDRAHLSIVQECIRQGGAAILAVAFCERKMAVDALLRTVALSMMVDMARVCDASAFHSVTRRLESDLVPLTTSHLVAPQVLCRDTLHIKVEQIRLLHLLRHAWSVPSLQWLAVLLMHPDVRVHAPALVEVVLGVMVDCKLMEHANPPSSNAEAAARWQALIKLATPLLFELLKRGAVDTCPVCMDIKTMVTLPCCHGICSECLIQSWMSMLNGCCICRDPTMATLQLALVRVV